MTALPNNLTELEPAVSADPGRSITVAGATDSISSRWNFRLFSAAARGPPRQATARRPFIQVPLPKESHKFSHWHSECQKAQNGKIVIVLYSTNLNDPGDSDGPDSVNLVSRPAQNPRRTVRGVTIPAKASRKIQIRLRKSSPQI